MLLKKTYPFNCVRFPAQISHFYTWQFQCPFGEMFFVLAWADTIKILAITRFDLDVCTSSDFDVVNTNT